MNLVIATQWVLLEDFRSSGEFVGLARGEIRPRKRLFTELKMSKPSYFAINCKSKERP